MLHFSLTIDEDVIKVDHHEISKEGLEDLIHQTHESAWGVGEAEWHNQPFIESPFSLKSRFPFISLMDPDLIIATSKLNLREDRGSM